MIAGLLAFTSHVFFQHDTYYETYFNESVEGLVVGSPVKFRGVNVGTVTQIAFVGSVYPKLAKGERINNKFARYIYVKMALKVPFMEGLNEEQAKRILHGAIEQGLRIRLTPSGLTGTVYLELNYNRSSTKKVLPITWHPQSYYIPSSPSTFTQLTDLFNEVHKANIPKIFNNMNTLLDNANMTIVKGQFDKVGLKSQVALDSITKTSKHLDALISDFDKVVKNKDLDQAMKNFEQMSASLKGSVMILSHTLNKANVVVASQQKQLQNMINNFDAMSENMRALTANLKDYPSQAIFGKAPPPIVTK